MEREFAEERGASGERERASSPSPPSSLSVWERILYQLSRLFVQHFLRRLRSLPPSLPRPPRRLQRRRGHGARASERACVRKACLMSNSILLRVARPRPPAESSVRASSPASISLPPSLVGQPHQSERETEGLEKASLPLLRQTDRRTDGRTEGRKVEATLETKETIQGPWK